MNNLIVILVVFDTCSDTHTGCFVNLTIAKKLTRICEVNYSLSRVPIII